jgi:hypothetical protein
MAPSPKGGPPTPKKRFCFAEESQMIRRSTSNTTLQVRAFLDHGHPWMAFGVLALRYVVLPVLTILSGATGLPALVHWLG